MRSWPALVVRFPAPDPARGVAIEDLVAAELDGLDILAVAEQPDGAWHIFFRDDEVRAAAARLLLSNLGWTGLTLTDIEVPDGDWARRSQAALGAVRVGSITVAPPWDRAAAAHDAGTLVIEPGMGFGSGHHATTRLCLAAMQRLDLRGKTVLDVGTGSGVLAIAALRLGAASALAIDIDSDALDNARSNAALNGSPAGIAFLQADFRTSVLPPADVVVANLTGATLAADAPHILRCCARPGALVLSGITSEEAEAVAAAFQPRAPRDWRAEEDGWCVFSLVLA